MVWISRECIFLVLCHDIAGSVVEDNPTYADVAIEYKSNNKDEDGDYKEDRFSV